MISKLEVMLAGCMMHVRRVEALQAINSLSHTVSHSHTEWSFYLCFYWCIFHFRMQFNTKSMNFLGSRLIWCVVRARGLERSSVNSLLKTEFQQLMVSNSTYLQRIRKTEAWRSYLSHFLLPSTYTFALTMRSESPMIADSYLSRSDQMRKAIETLPCLSYDSLQMDTMSPAASIYCTALQLCLHGIHKCQLQPFVFQRFEIRNCHW